MKTNHKLVYLTPTSRILEMGCKIELKGVLCASCTNEPITVGDNFGDDLFE